MNRISVCIVEDLPEIRSELEHIVRHADEFVLSGAFSSAEEALERLPDLEPDIVIMDINLPGMNGIECVTKATASCPKTQFMMFTIFEDSEQVFDALAAGASGYLLKNTVPAKITEAICELHAGGSPMSTQIARKVVASMRRKSDTENDALSLLSTREKEVLEWLSKGFLYKEVADKLGISTGTVRQHIHKIYEKLHVQNRTEALNKAYGKQNT